MTEKQSQSEPTILSWAKAIARVFGLALALPFFIWLPLSLLPSIPSIIDVFGMEGLRTPAGIVIGGLILAAFGFQEP